MKFLNWYATIIMGFSVLIGIRHVVIDEIGLGFVILAMYSPVLAVCIKQVIKKEGE